MSARAVAAAAGLIVHVGNDSFRATCITAYLSAGVKLGNAPAMAAHESARTTKLYDRTGDEITLEVDGLRLRGNRVCAEVRHSPSVLSRK